MRIKEKTLICLINLLIGINNNLLIMPKNYYNLIKRYAASARGEWDIIGDSQRLILRSQRNFEFLNKLDHRIEEENNKKISIDFKSKKSFNFK